MKKTMIMLVAVSFTMAIPFYTYAQEEAMQKEVNRMLEKVDKLEGVYKLSAKCSPGSSGDIRLKVAMDKGGQLRTADLYKSLREHIYPFTIAFAGEVSSKIDLFEDKATGRFEDNLNEYKIQKQGTTYTIKNIVLSESNGLSCQILYSHTSDGINRESLDCKFAGKKADPNEVELEIIEYDNCSYKGEIKNGKKSGMGTLTFKRGDPNAGDVYVGEFRDGKFGGLGTYTWNNGDVYTGMWKNGYRDGKGTYSCNDSSVYVGQYKNDKTSGPGTMTYPNGTRYVGELDNYHFSGEGILYDKDGGVVFGGKWNVGCLSGDCVNGTGKSFSKDGIFYSGEFKNSNKEGRGLSIESGGATYEGEYKNGYREGKGTYTFFQKSRTYSDGGKYIYVGDWVKDKKDGEGIFYSYESKDEYKFIGMFRDDRYGKGIIYNKDGSVRKKIKK